VDNIRIQMECSFAPLSTLNVSRCCTILYASADVIRHSSVTSTHATNYSSKRTESVDHVRCSLWLVQVEAEFDNIQQVSAVFCHQKHFTTSPALSSFQDSMFCLLKTYPMFPGLRHCNYWWTVEQSEEHKKESVFRMLPYNPKKFYALTVYV
jgi:hypothetical protein